MAEVALRVEFTILQTLSRRWRMDRRAVWLGMAVAVIGLATTAHLYMSGPIVTWISLGSLVFVAGALFVILKSLAPVQSSPQPANNQEWGAFFRTHRVWAIAYFLSMTMIFFGLWVLNDLYLSRNGEMFPRSMAQTAIASLVFGVVLFALSNHKTRE
jgi:hypothetical protein